MEKERLKRRRRPAGKLVPTRPDLIERERARKREHLAYLVAAVLLGFLLVYGINHF